MENIPPRQDPCRRLKYSRSRDAGPQRPPFAFDQLQRRPVANDFDSCVAHRTVLVQIASLSASCWYSLRYAENIFSMGKRWRAESRHAAELRWLQRSIASAMLATSSTMKPVTPLSIVSFNATRGNATTGTPDASASRATSELVS